MKLTLNWLSATMFLMGAPIFLTAATGSPKANRTPVLLELFTSEGCSSCPPAEALLDELDRTQPFANTELIVLSEHVDYWDQLGWKDPYSAAAFSARQRQYAVRVSAPDVYTPQVIVDGKWEAVGSDRGQIRRDVAQASAQPKLPINLEASRNGSSGDLRVTLSPTQGMVTADIYIVLAKNHTTSYVAHGENAHRTLSHTAVAYKIMELGGVRAGAQLEKRTSIDLPPNAGQTRIIAYVADHATGRVIGVAHALL